MTTKTLILFSILYLSNNNTIIAQNDTIKLKEIVISSSRIELPFSKNSRTISIISSAEIQNSTALNAADLLQQVAGIDVRRRGVDGMQSDLHIRGGSFEQTLILIDGIKTTNPQTGHHTMNMMIPLENIERIEIIKGSAARIFGQNAFTGAINIVTKKNIKTQGSIKVGAGSFTRKSISLTGSLKLNNSSHFVNLSNNQSNGYRSNTDFLNQNYFIKSSFSTTKTPINVIASHGTRKFGANNFYTNSPSFNEYEETATTLVGISSKIHKNKLLIKPKIYWQRNQDMFLLKRDDPSFSRNFNVINKIGAAIDASYLSKIGITGFGIETAAVRLSSNNLGNQNRTQFNLFIEQRFSLLRDKLDITPGISINYFSDFKSHAFPGLDIGYSITPHLKVYGNIGYSYRIPTYTELYIHIPNFLSGNNSLDPEKALSKEIGINYNHKKFSLSTAIFQRKSTGLIDYIKEKEDSQFFLAENLREINTTGFDVNTDYGFEINKYKQRVSISYTYLEDDYDAIDVYKSRYLINTSIKNHFSATLNSQFFKYIKHQIAYRYVERPTTSYQVVDLKITGEFNAINIFALFSNIFNATYSEKESVPMPKANAMFGLSYLLQKK